MSASSPDASSAFAPPSREEARRQFLAACAAGPPPDPDAFLGPFADPERSSLRDELVALQRSHARPTTADNRGDTRENDPGGTFDYVPAAPGTVDDVPAPGGTVDHVPAAGGGTVDHVPTPEGTIEHVRRSKRELDGPLPESVAGYEILGVLGRGAMGVVYKARQRGLQRLVALKMILSGEHASALDLGRFRAEANAVAHLQHAGIVQIYEVGEDNGRPFFSLEFVDGVSLHKKIQGTPLPPHEAATLLVQMAQAMAYAHEHGIIHRDLKPANVLLTSDGVPKIGDFGLAKRIEEEDSGLTRTGTVLGTPSYMSPEQAEARANDVGPLADVYSLGAILYDMLTGRPPFRGTSVLDTLEQLRTREPVPPMQFQPGVPRDLETICLKCLQKERSKRYASAGDLAADVQRFLNGEPILARPVSSAERLWRWCRRHPGRAAAIAAAVFGVLFYALTASVLGYVAHANALDARAKQKIAEEESEKQRKTARESIEGMVEVVTDVHNTLESKRLSINASPEVKKLRGEVLGDLRNSLSRVSKKIQTAATATYADLLAAQLMGEMLMKLGKSDEPRDLFQTAHQSALARVEREPNNDRARANLGIIEQRLGDVALDMDGDARTARKHYQASRDLRTEIKDHPKSGDFSALEINRALAHDDIRLGRALVALGQSAQARPYFQEALTYFTEWLDSEPPATNVEPRSYVMQARMWLGVASSNVGDAAGVAEHFAAAVALGDGLRKQAPGYFGFMVDQWDALGALGDAQVRQGKTADAAKNYDESLKHLKLALAKRPDDSSNQANLALAHERLGIVSELQKRPNDAQQHFAQAMQLRKELWEVEPKNFTRQVGLILALARAGKHDNAVALATTRRPLVAPSTALTLQLARSFARSAVEGTPAYRKNLADALSTLESATGEDFHDAVVLETDPDLLAVRSQPPYQALIARIKSR